ncbi:MAG: hypothetical protein AAGN82_30900, partial [Myxococcota bacterium]
MTGPYLVVLVRVVSQRWSGTVVTRDDDGLVHHTYFRDGAPCKVKPGAAFAPLDGFLLRLGGIEPHALSDAVAQACARPDLLLGEILLQRGLLTPEVLHSALRWQVLERLNHLMATGTQRGEHEMHEGQDLIPFACEASLHPADPMYCIMCASRLPACEPIAQRYIDRVRDMRLGLTGDVDMRRYGLAPDEEAVVTTLADGPFAYDELLEYGLPAPAVRRVVFALGVTQTLVSKGRLSSRPMTVPVPPPSVPAPVTQREPPASARVPTSAHGEEDRGGDTAHPVSVGRIKLATRTVRSSRHPADVSALPPSSVSPMAEAPLATYEPPSSMAPPEGGGPPSWIPSSSPGATQTASTVLPPPTPLRRRRSGHAAEDQGRSGGGYGALRGRSGEGGDGYVPVDRDVPAEGFGAAEDYGAAKQDGEAPAHPSDVNATSEGDASGSYAASEGDASGGYAAPEGDASGGYAAPEGDASGSYAAPEGDASGSYAAPEGDASGGYASSEGDASGGYAAPEGDVSGGYAAAEGHSGVGYGETHRHGHAEHDASDGYGSDGYGSGGYGEAERHGEAQRYASVDYGAGDGHPGGGYGDAERQGEAQGYASEDYGAGDGHPGGGYGNAERQGEAEGYASGGYGAAE